VAIKVNRDRLRRFPLFATVTDAQLDELLDHARLVYKDKDARVFEEDEPADCCYILTSGRAKVVISGRDDEIILATLEPYSLVGELALIDGSTRSAALVALEECEFLQIPHHAFDALRSDQGFEKRLVAHVVRTLRQTNDQLRQICSFGSIARVAWGLSQIARKRGTWHGESLVLQPRPPHQELAEMTGCSRETVTRKLKALKDEGCISWNKTSFRIERRIESYLATPLTTPDPVTTVRRQANQPLRHSTSPPISHRLR
jgi:CRP/FNR family transcriptional regulator